MPATKTARPSFRRRDNVLQSADLPNFDRGRVKPSRTYGQEVDVMKELDNFTLLSRDGADCLVDRDSKRRKSAEALSQQVNQRGIKAP